MEEINKREYDWLFSKGYLRCVKGRIPGIITGTKGKSGKSKFVKVEEPIYRHLEKMYKKQGNK